MPKSNCLQVTFWRASKTFSISRKVGYSKFRIKILKRIRRAVLWKHAARMMLLKQIRPQCWIWMKSKSLCPIRFNGSRSRRSLCRLYPNGSGCRRCPYKRSRRSASEQKSLWSHSRIAHRKIAALRIQVKKSSVTRVWNGKTTNRKEPHWKRRVQEAESRSGSKSSLVIAPSRVWI